MILIKKNNYGHHHYFRCEKCNDIMINCIRCLKIYGNIEIALARLVTSI